MKTTLGHASRRTLTVTMGLVKRSPSPQPSPPGRGRCVRRPLKDSLNRFPPARQNDAPSPGREGWGEGESVFSLNGYDLASERRQVHRVPFQLPTPPLMTTQF